MQEQINKKFNRKMMVIGPGEFFASKDDMVITTLLGSCVAGCFYDPVNKIIGMNHFLLVGDTVKSDHYFLSESGRYGINAMELLIDEMMKLGAKRNNIKAKAFGGAHVLNAATPGFTSIPESNVGFIKKFLDTENIELVSQDLGGIFGRKIFFFNNTFKILLKKLDSGSASKANNADMSYWKKQKARIEKEQREKKIEKEPDVDFFE